MSDCTDAGFTLPEALIAGALALGLGLPSFQLLRAAYSLAAAARQVSATNAAARQAFALLADGNSVSSNVEVATGATASSRGFAIVEGLRSRQAAPTGASLRLANRFTLSDGSLVLTGDSISPVSIACLGPAIPVPDCLGTETLVLGGWLGADPVIVAPSPQIGAGQTAAVSLTITNPFQAQTKNGGTLATERYRMMFNLNPEATW